MRKNIFYDDVEMLLFVKLNEGIFGNKNLIFCN
jgi:hypothetical protein